MSLQPENAVALLPDVRVVVQRSAVVRRGLALLHRAPVESVAVTLGVHPREVERARAALEAPGQRALAIAEFVRAVQRQRDEAVAYASTGGVLVYAG
jgi:hypothetical protein